MSLRARLLHAAVNSALLFAAAVTAAPLTNVRTAVLPFASVSVAERDLYVVAEAIGRKMADRGLMVVDAAETRQALQSSGCGAPETWNRETCVRLAGRDLGAHLLLGGTLNAIGSILEAHVELYAAESGKPIWSMDYQARGTLEDFYTAVPAKVAGDLPTTYEPPAPQAPAPAPQTVSEGSAEAPQPEQSPPAQPMRTTASGLVVGASAVFAMGDPLERQSPYGFTMHALYPTTEKSHVRLRLGLPLFHNYKLDLSTDSKYPDVMIALEHEWGWPSFGIGVGAAYMYMHDFSLEGQGYTYPSRSPDVAFYDVGHSLNITVNIRGGKPTGGFYGRLSWPLPYIFEDDNPNDLFVDYSAFGVFGGTRLKGGLGLRGMYKYREADYVRTNDSTYTYSNSRSSYYHDHNLSSTSEFFTMLPCLRFAVLWGGHLVTTVNLELAGTLLPRGAPDEDDDLWAPSIGVDLVYSFGALEAVSVMDGTF